MVLDLNDRGKTLVPVNNLEKCLSELGGSADTCPPLNARYRMHCYNSYTDVDFLNAYSFWESFGSAGSSLFHNHRMTVKYIDSNKQLKKKQ